MPAPHRRVRDPDRATRSTWTAPRSTSRVASVFVAQAAGVDMTLGQQLLMMLTLMLTSKGVAAVPRASLVILSGTLPPSACRSRAWP